MSACNRALGTGKSMSRKIYNVEKVKGVDEGIPSEVRPKKQIKLVRHF
jgi:hypothetical protein